MMDERKSAEEEKTFEVERLLETKITKPDLYQILENSPDRITYKANTTPHSKSDVWGKFKIVCLDEKPLSYVKCNNCITLFQWSPRIGTTTLLKHKCNIPEIKRLKCASNQQQLTDMFPKSVPEKAIEELNDTIVTGLALDLRPLYAVEGRGFSKIGQALINFGAKFGPHKFENVVKRRKALRNSHLFKIEDGLRSDVKDELRKSTNFPEFAFTFDLWTEQKRKRQLISLSCHFINNDLTKTCKLLSVEELPVEEKKTTINIRRACESIIEKYFSAEETKAIMEKSYAVTDGGSNVVSVFSHRLPCICHKLNLVMTNTFSDTNLKNHGEIQNILLKAKSLVKYFKQSGLNSRLKVTLKQAMPVRWNSNLTMLDSILTSFSEIQELLLEKKELERIVGLSENKILELVNLLKPFQAATEVFSSEKGVTIDQIVPQYFLLERALQASSSDSTEIAKLKVDMLHWLKHYYEASLETIHFAATSLNPKYKSLKMANETRKAAAYSYLKDMIESIHFDHSVMICDNDQPPPPKKAREVNSLREFEDSSDEDVECPVNEVDAYIDARLSKAERGDQNFCPLDFWRKCNLYPKLRTLAFRILAIPASQASDERTFSITGLTLNDRRSRLHGKAVSGLTFIHKNYE